MKDIDFDRAGMLLDVMAKCVNIGPMMSYIQGEAGEELKAINEDCRQNALERADDRRREEADRVAATQAQLNADEVQVTDGSETFEEVESVPPRAPVLRRP